MLRELRPGVEVDTMEVAPPGWDAGNQNPSSHDAARTIAGTIINTTELYSQTRRMAFYK